MDTTTNYALKKPAQTDNYNVDDFNDNADAIDAQMKANADAASAASTAANNLAQVREATFTASSWSESTPYTQTVTVTGVTASDRPIGIPDTRECADATAEKAMKKAYGYLTYFETGADTITATAKFEKPTVDIHVVFKGV